MHTYVMKLDDQLFDDWQRQAKAARVSLAELIRDRMRLGKHKDGKAVTKDATRTRRDPARRRRSGVAARIADQPINAGELEKFGKTIPELIRNSQRILAHDPTCQCGVCQFKREHLGKKK
jgi:hypothetical protein